MITGIYCIENLINKKKYIGQSINIHSRWYQHKRDSNHSERKGYDSPLHKAFRKYGIENFKFTVIEEVSESLLDERERFWIDYYNTLVPNGYNIETGGKRNKAVKIENNQRKYCPKCGKLKTIEAVMCQDCYLKERRENCILSKDKINFDLICEILNSSLEATAKKYGYASGNGLKKALIKAQLPCNRIGMLNYYKKETGKEHESVIKKKEKEEIRIKNAILRRPKPVIQYDLQGNFIKKYASATEAAKDGFSSGHISECCRGKRKTVKGYKWEYE